MIRSLEQSIEWYISAVRATLVLNFAVMDDEADKAIEAYGLRARIAADPEGELSNSIEGVAEDISRKEFLGRPCGLSYKGFETEIRYDSQIRHLYGKILGIEDFISFEADPSQDIEEEFHRAVDDYLAYKEQGGMPDINYDRGGIAAEDPDDSVSAFRRNIEKTAEDVLEMSDIDFLRSFGIDPEETQQSSQFDPAGFASEDSSDSSERPDPRTMSDSSFLRSMGIDPDDYFL